jgi:hypothetical protein
MCSSASVTVEVKELTIRVAGKQLVGFLTNRVPVSVLKVYPLDIIVGR